MTARPTTTRWPPARGEKYIGKWPPRFKTPPTKPLHNIKVKPRDHRPDYIKAMIEKHGSLENWEQIRGGRWTP
jgi:hypothetical protein